MLEIIIDLAIAAISVYTIVYVVKMRKEEEKHG